MHTWSVVLPIKDITKDKKEQIQNLTLCPLPSRPPNCQWVCCTRAQNVLFPADHGCAGYPPGAGHRERQLPGFPGCRQPCRAPATAGTRVSPSGTTAPALISAPTALLASGEGSAVQAASSRAPAQQTPGEICQRGVTAQGRSQERHLS